MRGCLEVVSFEVFDIFHKDCDIFGDEGCLLVFSVVDDVVYGLRYVEIEVIVIFF
jgi:hypothetical protein